MATVIRDCPHCPARPAMFSIKWSDAVQITTTRARAMLKAQRTGHVIACVATCVSCDGVIVFFAVTSLASLNHVSGNLESHDATVAEYWPSPATPVIPRHLDKMDEAKLLEAEKAQANHLFTAAAGLYRSLVDTTTKKQLAEAGESERGTLEARLDRLAEKHVIPKAVADWGHEVRVIANEALHEAPTVSEEDAEAARNFAQTYLRYAYELPGDIKARKAPDSS
jgi:hypothetical protein